MTAEAEALAAGCELWIVADSRSSVWSRKIDWYLNFQAMKAELHKPAESASELLKIIERWPIDHDLQTRPLSAGALMIASAGRLPNVQTVFVPYEGDGKGWASECAKIWQGLKRPRVRVFLPDALEADSFEKSWAKSAGQEGPRPQIIPAQLINS